MRIDPRPEHPRPDRRRDRWVNLNGRWECHLGGNPDDDIAPTEVSFEREIVVPFVFQAPDSGIGTTEPYEVVWYRRRFVPPERRAGERVLVHFGAVDFEATVWVDGTEVGRHRGGHTSFTCDATEALALGVHDHELVVRAVDRFRAEQLRGKQTATFPFMIHYTPCSGIWQPVWVEVAGSAWIHELHVVAGADGSLAAMADVRGDTARGAAVRLRLTIDVDGTDVVLDGEVAPRANGGVAVGGHVEGVRPWSPDEPVCYELVAELLSTDGTVIDVTAGHVGFRTVEIDGDEWFLNGRPLRQRLLLDQGWWPSSLITPPSDDAMLVDLRFVKAIGCNGVRKHQKVEDPRFLWHADRLGVLVWEELPSPFGLARLEGPLLDDALEEWAAAIERDRSHPCVIAWVPLNESWGVQGVHRRPERQSTVRRFVEETRRLDPTRPVVDNSGWGHCETDVVDVHDYDQDPARLAARWIGIEARGWDRGPEAPAGELAGFDLARWLKFAMIEDPESVDPRLLAEMLPDLRVWADGCQPAPGTAGPLVLSEMGGVGLVVGPGPDERFDYAGAADPDELLARFAALVSAAESVPELRGWCWTQLADTEQEVNGLMTADRRPKVAPSRLRAVIEGLQW